MKQTIETNAPSFSGFYNSIWEFDYEQELCYINESRRDNGLDELTSDNEIEIDYTNYKNNIAEQYCDVIGELLNDYIDSMKFIKIKSPREYNFTTDKIECNVTFDTNKIQEWCVDNLDTLGKYIKDRFTSRDGFISFFSNNVDVWINDTDNFTNFDFDNGWVYINTILECMFDENFSEVDDIYYDIDTNSSEYITNMDDLTN